MTRAAMTSRLDQLVELAYVAGGATHWSVDG